MTGTLRVVKGVGSSIARRARTLAVRLRERAQHGATAVEYGLMIALIAGVIIASVSLLGKNTRGKYDCVAYALSTSAAATKGQCTGHDMGPTR